MIDQFFPSAIANFLLNYATVTIAAVLLICLCVLFAVKRKTLTMAQKVLIGVAVLLCLVYLAFIVWLSIGFGHSVPDPTPHKPGT